MSDIIYPPAFYRNTPPSLNPSDRTSRGSPVGRSVWGPGLQPDTTAEWRETIGVFDTNRDVTTRNTCIFRGWNYDVGGSQIDPSQGSIGSGEENSYQPGGSVETWGESHPMRATPPSGPEKRIISGYIAWETGKTGFYNRATSGDIGYTPLVGEGSQMISWQSSTNIDVQCLIYYGEPNQRNNRQIEIGGTYFISLPYVADSNEIPRGHDPASQMVPIGRERGIRFLPTAPADIPTPGSGLTLFCNSATGGLSTKDSSGNVAAV